MTDYESIFSDEVLKKIFPEEKADLFFEALFGDANEGAYDITIKYEGIKGNDLVFNFNLDQRPGKCLVCSLTYGLPKVFKRHPVIDTPGIVTKILDLAGKDKSDPIWKIGNTISLSKEKHLIPLYITL